MEWTDELVLEFARINCQGPYGCYRGCNTIHKKLAKFKELNNFPVKQKPHPVFGPMFSKK